MSQPVPTDVRAPTLPLAGEERDWGARIRAGDAAAFERAFRTYHPALCKFAFRYVHSRDVAQELVHDVFATRSEEHTSELQSQSNLVCRLLLEKKKNTTVNRAHES